MIRIKIGNRKFKGAYSWDDISLKKFCDLAAIPMPEGYEAYILADGKFNTNNIEEYIEAVSKITDKQVNEDFPIYYRQVIACLSNVPVKLLKDEQVKDLYEYYFKPFVVSILYHAPLIHFMGQLKDYTPPAVKSFRVGLRKFYLPETVVISDQEISLANETAITYTEASDIFRGVKMNKEDIKRLALFMAIYCRKRKEKYNEKKALKRQTLMMKVPMSVVWSVFFYTLRRLRESTRIIQLFGRLPKQVEEVTEWARTYRGSVRAGLSSKQAEAI